MCDKIPCVPPSAPSGHLPLEGGGKNTHCCQESELGAPLAGELAPPQAVTEGGTVRRWKFPWKWLPAFLPPILLTALFYALKSNAALMDAWVHNILAPVMQGAGKVWSLLPFSGAEVLTALFLAGSAVWLVRAVVLLVRQQQVRAFCKRLLAFGCVLAWLWTAFCWTWNCTYYAPGFAEKHGLSRAPYAPEALFSVTVFFAYQASELSDQVPRQEDGSFRLTLEECFDRGTGIYEELARQYPSLALSGRKAKGLVCSRLQSILGYTGIYFPFTGEANVNIDQPRCLVPFTIAHEMAHQRFVAAEEECNFLGVLACISSEDVVYQYSGYLMGLIYLTNALHELSPELVEELMRQTFTPELKQDWDENYDYWQQFSSPVQEKAQAAMDEVYDGYLRSQGQSLGLMSYSACVDLLVNYFH